MGLGFSFRETMSGTYHRLDAPLDERAISFTIAAQVSGLKQFLRDKIARVEGEVTVEGLADHQPLTGSLTLKLLDEKRLAYAFGFQADDGQEYRFHGQKDVMLIALLDTMTTLPASLYDAAGREIARAVLRFDVRSDLKPFLRSWRPRMTLWTA